MMDTWRSQAYTTDFLRVLGVNSSRTVPLRLHQCTPSLPVISFVEVNNILTKSVLAQLRKFFLQYITIYYCSLSKLKIWVIYAWTLGEREYHKHLGVRKYTRGSYSHPRFFSVEQVTACMSRNEFIFPFSSSSSTSKTNPGCSFIKQSTRDFSCSVSNRLTRSLVATSLS